MISSGFHNQFVVLEYKVHVVEMVQVADYALQFIFSLPLILESKIMGLRVLDINHLIII